MNYDGGCASVYGGSGAPKAEGGSRWFVGDNETLADPTLGLAVGALPGVTTIYRPQSFAVFAGLPENANLLIRRPHQATSKIVRAADMQVYWGSTPGTVDSVIDVTHNLEVRFDEQNRSDTSLNEARAEVKNKLLQLHNLVRPEMLKHGWTIYPHWHKGWLVSAWYTSPNVKSIPFMSLRYSKPKALMYRMERLFLDEFSRFSSHAALAVTIDCDSLGVELSIPAHAWVDAQNLKLVK